MLPTKKRRIVALNFGGTEGMFDYIPWKGMSSREMDIGIWVLGHMARTDVEKVYWNLFTHTPETIKLR